MPLRALLLFELPDNKQDATDEMHGTIVAANVRYLRRRIRNREPLISLQQAADRGLVRYGFDTETGPGHSLYGVQEKTKVELLKTIPACLADGVIDCEDAAAWQTAWDNEVLNIPSILTIYSAGKGLEHVVHARPVECPRVDVFDHFIRFIIRVNGRDYRVIDTALALGM